MSLIAGNLAVVQRLLDSAEMPWAIFAGAAAHLYGNRRPIQDVDLLVAQGQLHSVVKLMQSSGKAVQFDGQRILWRGIKVFDDLTLRRAGQVYPLALDQPMSQRLRRMSLLGAQVNVVAPEDVVAHKLLLGRGAQEKKYDVEDVAGIIRRQSLDTSYLIERACRLGAEPFLRTRFSEMGIII